MINFLKRKIKEYLWRKMMKRYFKPNEDFLNSCRNAFINKICREISSAGESRFYLFVMWLKFSLAIFLGLAFLGSGAAVYADKANVDCGHPLYNLKRAVEAVRIELAVSEQLPVLHTQLAQRRLDEIKKIELETALTAEEVTTKIEDILDTATTTESTTTTTKKITTQKKTEEKIEEEKNRQELMANLRNQMRQEVSSVIEQIEKKQIGIDSIKELCQSVSQIMKGDEETDGDETEESHTQRWSRFQRNCGEFMKVELKNNQNINNGQR